MGKAIKLQNKKTGENLYPMSASDLVFDPVTKKSVKTDLAEKIGDAPSDGKQYARKDGSWSEVNIPESGIGEAPKDGYQYVRKDNNWKKLSNDEICLINLVSNQGEGDVSLNGASIVVTYTEDGSEIYNGVWNGQTIMLYIPEGKEYKVVVGSVDDYTTPTEQTFTSEMFLNRDVRFMYKTELVRVTLSAEDGSSVSGQIVTINGVAHTYGSTAVEQKVPFGTEYIVSVNDKTGYFPFKEQTFTASESVRNLAVVYKTITYGVFAQGVSGKLYTSDEWSEQEELNGLAFITEDCMFLYDPNSSNSGLLHIYPDNIPPSNLPVSSSWLNHFDGKGHTDILLEINDSPSYAAGYCYNQINKMGQHGYIPSSGEWWTVYENRTNLIKFGFSFTEYSSSLFTSTVTNAFDSNAYCITYFIHNTFAQGYSPDKFSVKAFYPLVL